MKTKKIIKKNKIDFFNILIIIMTIISSYVLIHDFIFWGIIPAFSKVFYEITYFGLFLDLISLFMLEMCIQAIKEW